MVFGKKQRKARLRVYEEKQIRERYERNEQQGADLYRRIAALEKLVPSRLGVEVLMLFKEARHQNELIRQSIKDRTGYDFDAGDPGHGDLATFLAEDVAYALRNNVTNPQTFFEAMSDQFPEVHFTIQQQDAISMVSAMIRAERIHGIIEGLQLAGVIKAS